MPKKERRTLSDFMASRELSNAGIHDVSMSRNRAIVKFGTLLRRDQQKALKMLAAERDCPVAELVQKAVDMLLAAEKEG